MTDKERIEKLEARIDKMAKYCKQQDDRIAALESLQPAYKLDPIIKMPKDLKEAFLKARKEFLPLNKSGKSKDGKTFAKFIDYRESTNKAFKDNGIIIEFVENKETMKLATIVFRGNDKYTMETDVKLANANDQDTAMSFGFLNAKTNVYKSLTQLVIAKQEQLK